MKFGCSGKSARAWGMNHPLAGIVLSCGLALAREAGARPGGDALQRFEETGPAVTRTGSWSTNSLSANSAGTAMLTMDAGARAVFAFSGVSVTWVGYRDEWCGLADVFLDGVFQATVDTYAAPARPQAPLYAVSGLSEGNHTLTIEARGTHGSESSGSWVWVDAFVVSGPVPFSSAHSSEARPSRLARSPAGIHAGSAQNASEFRAPRGETARFIDEEDPSVTWIGSWSINRLPAHRGHSARLSMESAARVDIAFTGTGVRIFGYRDEWSGIAEVFVDGTLRDTVDTYSNPARAQAEIYGIEGLQDGPHTLTMRPAGRRGPSSSGAWIWVDTFAILGRASKSERER